MDFTLSRYKTLLLSLLNREGVFLAFVDYIRSLSQPAVHEAHPHIDRSSVILDGAATRRGPLDVSPATVILRHDVDRLPQNSLRIAQLEHSLGIRGTYYFRVVPVSYDPVIMDKIARLGHEIGYHYEDVDLTRRDIEEDIEEGKLVEKSYESFRSNLEMLRKNFDIQTICMHGSPRSRFDNRIIWQKYDYRKLGILGEPYFDVDFNKVAYFTDTGRRWNGAGVSVRDKVGSGFAFDFRTTRQIISHIRDLPPGVMFTIHPQRWNERFGPWMKELMWQNIKNIAKRILVSRG